MSRSVDPSRIELIDPRIAEALRGKTATERLAMAFEANRMARLVIEGSLRTRHPDWGESQIRREVARRMLGTG